MHNLKYFKNSSGILQKGNEYSGITSRRFLCTPTLVYICELFLRNDRKRQPYTAAGARRWTTGIDTLSNNSSQSENISHKKTRAISWPMLPWCAWEGWTKLPLAGCWPLWHEHPSIGQRVCNWPSLAPLWCAVQGLNFTLLIYSLKQPHVKNQNLQKNIKLDFW